MEAAAETKKALIAQQRDKYYKGLPYRTNLADFSFDLKNLVLTPDNATIVASAIEVIDLARTMEGVGTRSERRRQEKKEQRFLRASSHLLFVYKGKAASHQVYLDCSLKAGKRGEGLTHVTQAFNPVTGQLEFNRHKDPDFPGRSASSVQSNPLFALACALGGKDHVEVFHRIKAPLHRIAEQLQKSNPDVSRALYTSWGRGYVSLKLAEDRAKFRLVLVEIVKEAFSVDVLFASTVDEALHIWETIREMHENNKAQKKKKVTIVGMLDSGFGTFCGLRVDPHAQDQRDEANKLKTEASTAASAAAAEFVKRQQEKELEKKKKKKKETHVEKMDIEQPKAPGPDAAMEVEPAVPVLPIENSSFSSSSKRGRPKGSKNNTRGGSNLPTRGGTRSSTLGATPVDTTPLPTPRSTTASTTASTKSSASASSSMEVGDSTLPASSSFPKPKVSPRYHSAPATTGRRRGKKGKKEKTEKTAVKGLVQWRIQGGLSREMLTRFEQLLNRVWGDTTYETPKTSEWVMRVLLGVIEGRNGCDRFSLSTSRRGATAVFQLFWDCSYIGRLGTDGLMPVVATKAVNAVYALPLQGQVNGEQLSSRRVRIPGDNAILNDEAHGLEVAALIHWSFKKAKTFIVGTLDTWLERAIGEHLLQDGTAPNPNEALFFNVMVTKPTRKAVALEIFERFARRDAPEKTDDEKDLLDEPLTATRLTVKRQVDSFITNFNTTPMMAFLNTFWTKFDELAAAPGLVPLEDVDFSRAAKTGKKTVEVDEDGEEINNEEEEDEDEGGEEADNDGDEDAYEDKDDAEDVNDGEKADSDYEKYVDIQLSKAKNLFAKVLHSKSKQRSAGLWAIIELYIAMSKKRYAWLEDAKAHGAWTPPRDIVGETIGIQKASLEQPDQPAEDEDDVKPVEIPITPDYEDKQECCRRSAHTCRKLFDAVPQAHQRSRYITLRDSTLRELLAGVNNDILVAADVVAERIKRDWISAGGPKAKRVQLGKGPNLLDAFWYMKGAIDGKSHEGREQTRMANVQYDGVGFVAKFSFPPRLWNDVQLYFKSLFRAQMGPSFGSFRPPDTASQTRQKEAAAAKEHDQLVSTNAAALLSTRGTLAAMTMDRDLAQANLTNFNVHKPPGCQGCKGLKFGRDSCVKNTCSCYEGNGFCVQGYCGCTSSCGNRHRQFPKNANCDACLDSAQANLFVCSGDKFACGRQFHRVCFLSDTANSTRCRACSPLFNQFTLQTLLDAAESAVKRAKKDVERAEKAVKDSAERVKPTVKSNSPFPAAAPTTAQAPSTTPQPQPPIQSPSKHLLAITRVLVVDLRKHTGSVAAEDEVIIEPNNNVRTQKQSTGILGSIDIDDTVLLDKLRAVVSVSFRAGVFGKKTKFSWQLPVDLFVYGEESARAEVHKIVSTHQRGQVTRSYLNKKGSSDVEVPLEWVKLDRSGDAVRPKPRSARRKTEETLLDHFGKFGPSFSDAEKLAYAEAILPRAHRMLGLAADEVVAIDKLLDEQKKARANGTAPLRGNQKKATKKEYAIARKEHDRASKRIAVLNLIVKARGKIAIVSIDTGRRNNYYGSEFRPDGSEKTWVLPRGKWRDAKGDDSRARSSRKRTDYLQPQFEILKTVTSSTGDFDTFSAYMAIRARVRDPIIAEMMKPVWRQEGFEAWKGTHAALDKAIADIQRGEPDRGTGGRRQVIIVLGDGSFASNSRGSRSMPTVALRRAFVVKFGRDAVVDVDEHRSTKCCFGCGCVLAKIRTYGKSQFAERKFEKKLDKQQKDYEEGRTFKPPDTTRHSRQIEGLVQCQSDAEQCPLYGGHKIDRDGNAARTIGESFMNWLHCLPPPDFMSKGFHPEDEVQDPVYLHSGSSRVLRWVKERYPPAVLRPILATVLISSGQSLKSEEIERITKSILSGIDVSMNIIQALYAYFEMGFDYSSEDDESDTSSTSSSSPMSTSSFSPLSSSPSSQASSTPSSDVEEDDDHDGKPPFIPLSGAPIVPLADNKPPVVPPLNGKPTISLIPTASAPSTATSASVLAAKMERRRVRKAASDAHRASASIQLQQQITSSKTSSVLTSAAAALTTSSIASAESAAQLQVVIPTVAAPTAATLTATSANLMQSSIDSTTAAAAALKSAASFALAASGHGSLALQLNQQADQAMISSEESPLQVHPTPEIISREEEIASFDDALFKAFSPQTLPQRMDASRTTTTRQGRGGASDPSRKVLNVPTDRGRSSHTPKGAVQEGASSTRVNEDFSSSRARRKDSGEMEIDEGNSDEDDSNVSSKPTEAQSSAASTGSVVILPPPPPPSSHPHSPPQPP